MAALLLIALAGFGAQLVDGSLGMGYGLTSSTLLMAIGLTPALASASVHLAEIGTTAASGLAHGKLGNVDKRVLWRISIPGGVGAFMGATILAGLSTQAARPWASAILLALGIYVLMRFLRTARPLVRRGRPGTRLLVPLGLVGGFVDATGGGGWGPVTTPALLANGRMAPNRVVGTMNAAEFVVAVSASAGFIVGLGASAIQWNVLLPLLIGGLIAAPIAAWITHRLPMRIMGVGVGGMIIVTNSVTILRSLQVPTELLLAVLAVELLLWAGLLLKVSRPVPVRDAETWPSKDRSHAQSIAQ
ncbi:MAG: sulfite exporter TauE/SafE family protein [Actinomycetales bacterium]|nr:sulfite exporter TauE/SafE family protein [Actinomycetales bacterium]